MRGILKRAFASLGAHILLWESVAGLPMYFVGLAQSYGHGRLTVVRAMKMGFGLAIIWGLVAALVWYTVVKPFVDRHTTKY